MCLITGLNAKNGPRKSWHWGRGKKSFNNVKKNFTLVDRTTLESLYVCVVCKQWGLGSFISSIIKPVSYIRVLCLLIISQTTTKREKLTDRKAQNVPGHTHHCPAVTALPCRRVDFFPNKRQVAFIDVPQIWTHYGFCRRGKNAIKRKTSAAESASSSPDNRCRAVPPSLSPSVPIMYRISL